MIQVWESLLEKLKEFELFHALRALILPLDRRPDGGLVQPALDAGPRAADGVAALERHPAARLHGALGGRPAGRALRHDLRHQRLLARSSRVLQRAAAESQDESFRSMFRFQRRVNRLASLHRLKLEKYLGDGAFYSGREARPLLVTAVHVQRLRTAACCRRASPSIAACASRSTTRSTACCPSRAAPAAAWSATSSSATAWSSSRAW